MSAQGILREDASCQSFGERNDLLPPIFDEISLSCFRELGFWGGGVALIFYVTASSLLLSFSLSLLLRSVASTLSRAR
jgi:hypothetical protein